MSSSDSSSGVARSGSPSVSFDDDRVVLPLLAVRSAFRHSNGNDDEIRILQPDDETRGHDQSSPRSPPAPVLSPGSRFDGLTRLESHADLRRRPERASRHAASLYALCAFRDCTGSRFRYELTPHRPRCDAPGTSPEGAAFVDGAHHFFATSRLATTSRAIMASDVGRGLRAAACRQREGSVRAHSSREWNTAESPPRGRPRTSSVIGPGA
jgi:hypothetical protein